MLEGFGCGTYDEDEATLASRVGGINSIIRQPVIKDMMVDPIASQNGSVLYDFTGGNALIDDYSNVAFDTTTPPTVTGSTFATGVIAPVLPT